jgi:hypothetical protein
MKVHSSFFILAKSMFLSVERLNLKNKTLKLFFIILSLTFCVILRAENNELKKQYSFTKTIDSQGAELNINDIYSKINPDKPSLVSLYNELEQQLAKYRFREGVRNYNPENIEKIYNRLYYRPEIKTSFDNYLNALESFLKYNLGLSVQRSENMRILYVTGAEHAEWTQLGRFLQSAQTSGKYKLKISPMDSCYDNYYGHFVSKDKLTFIKDKFFLEDIYPNAMRFSSDTLFHEDRHGAVARDLSLGRMNAFHGNAVGMATVPGYNKHMRLDEILAFYTQGRIIMQRRIKLLESNKPLTKTSKKRTQISNAENILEKDVIKFDLVVKRLLASAYETLAILEKISNLSDDRIPFNELTHSSGGIWVDQKDPEKQRLSFYFSDNSKISHLPGGTRMIKIDLVGTNQKTNREEAIKQLRYQVALLKVSIIRMSNYILTGPVNKKTKIKLNQLISIYKSSRPNLDKINNALEKRIYAGMNSYDINHDQFILENIEKFDFPVLSQPPIKVNNQCSVLFI